MRSKGEVVGRYFLEVRARLIELAAFLDRLERASGELSHNEAETIDKIRAGLSTLLDERPDKTARVHMVFSVPFDPGWRTKLSQSESS